MHETTEPFDGYPYLVTRIGRRALRHVAVLATDWARGRRLGVAAPPHGRRPPPPPRPSGVPGAVAPGRLPRRRWARRRPTRGPGGHRSTIRAGGGRCPKGPGPLQGRPPVWGRSA